jgi:hypothetical protein
MIVTSSSRVPRIQRQTGQIAKLVLLVMIGGSPSFTNCQPLRDGVSGGPLPLVGRPIACDLAAGQRRSRCATAQRCLRAQGCPKTATAFISLTAAPSITDHQGRHHAPLEVLQRLFVYGIDTARGECDDQIGKPVPGRIVMTVSL